MTGRRRAVEAVRAAPGDRRPWWRVPALYGLAVAQPVLGLIGGAPEFLVAHRLRPAEVLAFVALVAFAPPLTWLLLERGLARVAPRVARGARTVAGALLVAALTLQAIRGAPMPGGLQVGLALALGLSLTVWIERRSAGLRMLVGLLAAGLVVFPIRFLARPQVASLLEPPVTATGPAVAARVPVVIVVFDELPLVSLLAADGRIDAARFPAFARLAGTSTWYRQATTVAPSTTYAVPAIVTGCYPHGERLATVSDYPHNLFTWLGTGYRFNVAESITQLCPSQRCGHDDGTPSSRLADVFRDLRYVYLHLLLPAELASGLPDVSAHWRDFGTASAPADAAEGDPGVPPRLPRDDVGGEIARFVNLLDERGRASLHYLHLNLPHVPWHFMPSGRRYGPIGSSDRPFGLGGEGWMDDPWPSLQGRQRHLLQVGYADRVLGELLAALDDSSIGEEALVIVTSDHGTAFEPGSNRRSPTAGTYGDILRVPLFVRYPGGSADIDDREAATIDILPTIADALGEEYPWDLDGRPLRLAAPPPRAIRFFPVSRYEFAAHGGEIAGIEVAAHDLDLTASLERRLAHFGQGSWERVFAIGPRRDLVGTAVGDGLATVPSPRVVLSEPRSFESIDLASWYLPTQIEGRLDFGGAPGRALALAIAVGGVVRATTWSVEDRWDPRPRFAAMVPESVFADGLNQVEIFEIPSEASAALVRLAGRASETYRMVAGPHGEVLGVTGAGQRTIRVAPETFRTRAHRRGDLFWGRVVCLDGSKVHGYLLFANGELRLEVKADPGGYFDFRVPPGLLAPGDRVQLLAYHGAAAVALDVIDADGGGA